MNPKQQILKFIQKAYVDISPSDDAKEHKTSETHDRPREILQEIFDGMSTGTGRIIIEQKMSHETQEGFNIDQVENQGRYYLARIVRHDGTTIQRLLVDKQTGNVQMV